VIALGYMIFGRRQPDLVSSRAAIPTVETRSGRSSVVLCAAGGRPSSSPHEHSANYPREQFDDFREAALNFFNCCDVIIAGPAAVNDR
jgi:hypothetical protein